MIPEYRIGLIVVDVISFIVRDGFSINRNEIKLMFGLIELRGLLGTPSVVSREFPKPVLTEKLQVKREPEISTVAQSILGVRTRDTRCRVLTP